MFAKKVLVQPNNGDNFNKKMYPIHEASQLGKFSEFKDLLSNPDFNLSEQDIDGKTVLHHAVSYGDEELSLKMLQLIFDTQPDPILKQKFVNIQDNNGETCLHLAAKIEHTNVVVKLIFAGADVNKKSKKGVEPIELIYSKVPHAMSGVFDTVVRLDSGSLGEENYQVSFDFGPIVGYAAEDEEDDDLTIQSYLLFYALKSAEHKCKDILVHPLVKMFLHLKWGKVRCLFFTSMILHIIWLLLYTLFVLNVYLQRCPYSQNNLTVETDGTVCQTEIVESILAVLTMVFSIGVFIKEIYQMTKVPSFWYYIRHLENTGQLLLILNVALITYPIFVGFIEDTVYIHNWQYEAAALGIFLAWVLILAQVGKTPNLGLYVEILIRVLRSFYLFVVTFISLLVAFALSFSIVMPKDKNFEYFPLALAKVLVMMTGELNYNEVFYDSDGERIQFFGTCHLLFVTFTIIVTIILFNLLIGLTVSDIQGLQASANISLLKVQLGQIYLMESFIFSSVVKWISKRTNMFQKLQIMFQITDRSSSLEVVLPLREIPLEWRQEIKSLVVKNMPKYNQENSKGADDKLLLKNLTRDITNIVRSVLISELQNFKGNIPYIDHE